MTTSQKQLEFEKRVGLELISEHTWEESKSTKWFLRFCKFESGKKSWVLRCEFNGEESRGTRQTGTNLSKDLREMFNINN